MDVKEKLVELQSIITCPNAICNFCEHFKNKGACEKHKKEVIADNMIANGVTVQEWIPVTERLPERDKEVLLIVHGWEDRLYYTGCLHRQEAERSWLTGIESKASDWKIWGFSYLREPIVTHWMPLPNPPKGE